MANGKSDAEILEWYTQHINILKRQEQNFFAQLTPQAKKSIEKLLSLTSEDSQNKEIEKSIIQIEKLITNDFLQQNTDVKSKQQQIAKAILDMDKKFQLLGNDYANLEALANGQYDKVISSYDGSLTLVADKELNEWITKILYRIEEAEKENYSAGKFGGYINDLKGAYLEKLVTAELQKILPIDVYNTGNIVAEKQIAEDILLVFGDKSKQTLQNYINNQQNDKRITLTVPAYSEIQKGSTGISVKAGKGAIKFYEGSLLKFFSDDDEDIIAYHNNVICRWKGSGHKDNAKGRSVNRYLTAMHLNYVFRGQMDAGGNTTSNFSNLFLSTRKNLLTTMSSLLTNIRDNKKFLSMTYNLKQSLMSGRITRKV